MNIDMRNDLPRYLKNFTRDSLSITGIEDTIVFNTKDSVIRIPYGQALFKGILEDSTTTQELGMIKSQLETKARQYFNTAMEVHQLDAILSINNYHAAYATVAKYPALAVPMGYGGNGEPKALTFITKPFGEALLLQLGHAYQQRSKMRKAPAAYLE